MPAQVMDVAQIEQICPKCKALHKLYAKFVQNSQIDKELSAQGFTPFPKGGKIKCKCGFEIDLLGIRNQMESQAGRKILI
jgi:phage FluMu protein Com